MKQLWAMFVGAALGAIAWWLFRGSTIFPDAFLTVAAGAWVGIGLYGVIRGELTIGGRRAGSQKTYSGNSARLIGLVVIALSIAFILWAQMAR
jgi:hypothetical protein